MIYEGQLFGDLNFKLNIGSIFSLDVRGKPLSEAAHWAESSSIGQRSSFRTNKSPNSLVVENLNLKVRLRMNYRDSWVNGAMDNDSKLFISSKCCWL